MQSPQNDCPWLIMDNVNSSLLSAKIHSLGWAQEAAIKRPTDKDETLVIFRPAKAIAAPVGLPQR
jgi:hypothetical protein